MYLCIACPPRRRSFKDDWCENTTCMVTASYQLVAGFPMMQLDMVSQSLLNDGTSNISAQVIHSDYFKMLFLKLWHVNVPRLSV